MQKKVPSKGPNPTPQPNSDQALRYNKDKVQLSLIPQVALVELAKVLQVGATKYERDNWRKGLPYTSVLDSIQRHLTMFAAGQNNDEETGLSHIAHVMCNCAFLLEYATAFNVALDDRYMHTPEYLNELHRNLTSNTQA